MRLADRWHRVPRSLLSSARQAARAARLRALSRWAAWRRGAESPPVARLADCRYCLRQQTRHWALGRVGTTHPGPFARDAYDLLHCTACEVVYLEPLPSAADLQVLYAGSIQFSDPHYSDPAKAARLVDYYFRRLELAGVLPAAGSHSLEVGAGLAWVSHAIKERIAGVETWAQDPSAECADGCPWVDHYEVGPLEVMQHLPPFALISLTHVIEHVPDPNAFLAHLATRLMPGGAIFMTAPFRPAGWASGDGIAPWRDYSYLHVPAHIAYLSRDWLRDAATRAGLVLVHWEQAHDGHQAFEAVLRRAA